MKKQPARLRALSRTPRKPKRQRNQRVIAYVYLLINLVCWGAAFPLIKPALDVTTPFRYLFYRFTLASILCIPLFFYYARRHKKITWSDIFTISVIEIIGTVLSLALLYEGLARTTSLETGLIASTTPLFTVLGGMWYLKEKQERHEWVGLVLAFTGTILITIMPLFGQERPTFSLFGNLLVVAQNLVSAVYYILVKKYFQPLPKFFTSAVSFVIGAVFFGLFSLWEVRTALPHFFDLVKTDLSSPSVMVAVVYMATFGSIIGLTAYFKGQENIEASEAIIFAYLEPLVFIPLGFFLLGETMNWIQVVALVLIVAGVWISERRNISRSS